MKLIPTLLLCACGLLFTWPSQARGWRGIVPLHSTRDDVERIIGKPNSEYGLYDFENERVSIRYTGDPCPGGTQGGYNVPRDTVIAIDVAPKQKLMASDLGVDLSKYEKTVDQHSNATYRNEEDGITILTVDRDGEDNGDVLKIHYWPSSRDDHLRCAAATPRQPDKEGESREDRSRGPEGDGCPAIYIVGPSGDMCHNQRYVFSATLAGTDPRFKPTYKWRVSAGTIVSGQGTHAIEVDVRDAAGKQITATLEVGGVIPRGCQRVECYTAECPGPNKVAQK